MGRREWVLAAMVVMASAVSAPAAASVDPRVRCTSPPACNLLRDGVRRSPTLADLVERIERSDLIVYLRLGEVRPGAMGVTQLIGSSPFARFVLVTVKPLAPALELLARLGHELQHVIEIAEAPGVCNDDSMREQGPGGSLQTELER